MGILMDTFVMTTFVIIMAFSLINLLVSLTIYATSKKSLYARTALFWLSLIINFFIQSQAQEGESIIVLGFGFSIIPLNLLAYASLFFCGVAYPKKILIPLSAASLIVTLLIINLPIPFTLKALPFSIASAVPLIYTVCKYIQKRKQTTGLMALQGVVLFLFSIHCFNFAFFRMVPAAQLWGWPVAYGLYQLLAMLIPAMTLEFYHNEEHGRLKMEVDKRTRELEIKNLELKTLAKENQNLLSILLHDMSNPVQVMVSFSNKVASKLPPEFTESNSRFERALDSMLETLKTVREYHGTKLGKIVPSMKVISAVDPLKQCIALYEDKFKAKDLNVLVDYDESREAFILVDPTWLKNQIFSNIISNAIKFSPKGGQIKISLQHELEAVKIQIRDFGVGIPHEVRQNIFSTSKPTTSVGTDGEKGTGLGMPIVKEYMERLDAKIQILDLHASEKGTCFELEFKTHNPKVEYIKSVTGTRPRA